MSYDMAGDLLNDGLNNYTYDGEGRIATGAGVTYSYGDGKRVKKSNGKLYWYGAGSDPLMETDFSGNVQYEYIFFGEKRIARQDGSGNRNYYFADHLGTARVVTNASGSVLDDSDFCPFGRECYVASSSSGNAYKFTGKERDGESSLDYFGARHYSSQYGRFMSADWSANPTAVPYADFSDPQSLNLYGYVRNNPLAKPDVDGHCPWCVTAAIGAVTGFVSSIVAQRMSGGGISWSAVAVSTAAGAIAGATFGILTAPTTIASIVATGNAITVSSAGVGTVAAAGAVSGTVGGVAGRIMTTGSLNQAMSDPKAMAQDAGYGAASATVGKVVTGPIESVKDLNVSAAEKLGLDSAQTTSYANGVTTLSKTIKGGVGVLANQLKNPPQQQNHLKPPPPSCNKNNGSCM